MNIKISRILALALLVGLAPLEGKDEKALHFVDRDNFLDVTLGRQYPKAKAQPYRIRWEEPMEVEIYGDASKEDRATVAAICREINAIPGRELLNRKTRDNSIRPMMTRALSVVGSSKRFEKSPFSSSYRHFSSKYREEDKRLICLLHCKELTSGMGKGKVRKDFKKLSPETLAYVMSGKAPATPDEAAS